MGFPKENQSCGCPKNASRHTCGTQGRSAANQDMCGLCKKQVFYVSFSNEMPVEGNLPADICQCFFSMDDVPEEMSYENEQNTRPPVIQVDDSQDVSLHPVKDKSCTEKSSNIAKTNIASSGEESRTPEFSHSSTGYISSLDLSSDRSLIGRTSITSPSSGEGTKSSPRTGKDNSSSGYAISVDEQSPDLKIRDRRDFTSPSSGEGTKKSSSTDKGPLSDCAMSIEEQSPDQNFSDHKNITDENSKNSSIVNETIRIRNLNDAISLQNMDVTQYKSSDSSSERRYGKHARREESDTLEFKQADGNDKNHYAKGISTEVNSPRFEKLAIRFANLRPTLPKPFPQHPQPYPMTRNPAIIVSGQSRAPFQPTFMPPIVRVAVPVRPSVEFRPQISTSHSQGSGAAASGNLSKKLLAEVQKVDPEENTIKKKERIENWLEKVENIPPDEEYSTSEQAAENEESPPCFPGSSTDERSSTEKSEEENRRQRALRRPPRNLKRNRPK